MSSPPSPSSPSQALGLKSTAAPFVPSFSLSTPSSTLPPSPSLTSHSGHRSHRLQIPANSFNPSPPPSPSSRPRSARQSKASHRAASPPHGPLNSGGQGPASAALAADAPARSGGGAAAIASAKKGKGRGEVLTSMVEFQFAKKEAPSYAVSAGMCFGRDDCRLTCDVAGRVLRPAAFCARKAAA
jgi:hypothetical protein